MKHFAQFAPSYNNIGLGVGAAVGLARGSGLIGESQEERDSTTGLGRLGKLAGYGGGGAALGAGTGMAVNAGTKYLRGRKGTVPEPRPQDRTTSAEPWDDDWTKPRRRPNRDEAAKNLEEKIAAMDKAIPTENLRAETVTPKPLSRPTGYSGLNAVERAKKRRERANIWTQDSYGNYPHSVDANALEARNAGNMSQEDLNKLRGTLEKDTNYKTLVGLQDKINTGRYSKPTTNWKNF